MKPLNVIMNNDGYLIEFAYTSSWLPKQPEKMNLPYKADWDGKMISRIDWVSRRVAGHLRDEYSIQSAKKAILDMIAEKQNLLIKFKMDDNCIHIIPFVAGNEAACIEFALSNAHRIKSFSLKVNQTLQSPWLKSYEVQLGLQIVEALGASENPNWKIEYACGWQVLNGMCIG